MTLNYDLILVGAGPVGLALACALGKSSLKIAVISNTVPSTISDQRVSALTRASQRIFESLDVWTTIAEHVSPYRHMQVWESGGAASIEFANIEFANIEFDSADLAEPNLGYIIENRIIQTALFDKLHSYSNITFIAPVKLLSLELGSEKQLVQLSDGQSLSCRLLVGADGAQSAVREFAGISMSQSDYGHNAIVTTVRSELPHQETARQIFLPKGPLAFLPLIDAHTCSIVWSTEPTHAQELLAMTPDNFKIALAEAFEHRLGAIESVDELLSFPLRMQHVTQYVKPGLALVGDAAHTLHPLAGQGVNLGLLDSACLAEVLLEALEKKRDIGALSTLRRYERWRKGHNATMIGVMQGFKSLFASENPMIQKMRRLGLQMTDSLPFVKHIFMRRAMGLVGDLPKMAQR
jgi:2-octaprenylphenol hydroxylase